MPGDPPVFPNVYNGSRDILRFVAVQFFSYTVPLWAFLFLAILVFLVIWMIVRFAVRYFLYLILIILFLVVLDMLGVLTWLQTQLLHLFP